MAVFKRHNHSDNHHLDFRRLTKNGLSGLQMAARQRVHSRPRAVIVSGIQALLIFLLAMEGFVGGFSFPLYFDEVTNLHFLSELHRGGQPHSEFWSIYPTPGYLIYSALFGPGELALTAWLKLRLIATVLASCSICLIASSIERTRSGSLAVLAAAILYMSDAKVLWSTVQFKVDPISGLLAALVLVGLVRGSTIVCFCIAAASGVMSVLIMPKSVYLIIPAIIALAWRAWQIHRVRGPLMVGAACAGGTALFHLLCVAGGTTLLDDLRYSHLLVFQHSEHNADARAQLNLGGLTYFLPSVFGPFVERNKLFVAIVVASVAVWCWRFRSLSDGVRAGGVAILAGTVLFLCRVTFPYDQYLNPLWMPLLAFPGFAVAAMPAWRSRCVLLGSGLLLAVAITVPRINSLLPLASSGLVAQISQIESLERLIRKDDVVLGAPIFPPSAKSATFITFDEVGSGFEKFIADPRVRNMFAPESLEKSLRERSPVIIMESMNYPAGWRPIIAAYVQEHADEYQRFAVAGWYGYVLKCRLENMETR